MNWLSALSDKVTDLEQSLISDRRHFHMHPEVGRKEFKTAAYISQRLESMGLTVQNNIADTGVMALIKGTAPSPVILYRADMDALPLLEKNEVPYCSQYPGFMHGCGHDVHMSIALGIAQYFARYPERLSGCLKVVFQPDEETEGGAERMVQAGVMENPKVDYVLGLHVHSGFETGYIGLTPGSCYAACQDFSLQIHGKGGHAAHPEDTVDPIMLAARLITATPLMINREMSVFEPSLISFGVIQAGTQENIIPDSVLIKGTMRALKREVLSELTRKFVHLIDSLVSAAGARFDVKFELGYPPVVNDKRVLEYLAKIAASIVGSDRITQSYTMGAEDVGYFLEKAPGCYLELGVKHPDWQQARPEHSSTFDIDERAMPLALQIMVNAIEQITELNEK